MNFKSAFNSLWISLASVAGGAFFFWSLTDLTRLFSSADAFRLHHEVTTPLSILLAKIMAGLIFGRVVLFLQSKEKENGWIVGKEIAAFALVALLLTITSFVYENESFFTLYDNKSLPVHPTEIVMFPNSGWMTAIDHLLLSATGLAAIILFLFFTKKSSEKTEQN